LLSVIRRERARADRQKSQFSLVMFRLVPARGRWATLRLCKIVLDQIRATDELGQFDRHTVCAILPDTAPDGAWKLIDRVNEAAGARQMSVEPVIYTYPTNWIAHRKKKDDDSDAGQSGGGRGLSDSSDVADWVRRAETDAPTIKPRLDTLPLETLLERRPDFWKRLLDVVVAGSVLTVAAPVMLGVAAAIKLGSDGPIIFKQWRSGMGGRPFQIYKFRTMCNNADAMKAQLRAQSEQDGPAFKMTRDPRVTRIGAFLRKTSLDELPQLINVLKGDMSLVGPRPLPLDEQAQCDQWHRGRLDVMPGLTCIWQVYGRSQVTFEEWMRMDLGYIKRYRVWEDLKLMFATVPAVLLRRGAK
jgi:lipopolysaccharide/colanic/teichoic acid biosynthesis glycosyltransferase